MTLMMTKEINQQKVVSFSTTGVIGELSSKHQVNLTDDVLFRIKFHTLSGVAVDGQETPHFTIFSNSTFCGGATYIAASRQTWTRFKPSLYQTPSKLFNRVKGLMSIPLSSIPPFTSVGEKEISNFFRPPPLFPWRRAQSELQQTHHGDED